MFNANSDFSFLLLLKLKAKNFNSDKCEVYVKTTACHGDDVHILNTNH